MRLINYITPQCSFIYFSPKSVITQSSFGVNTQQFDKNDESEDWI